VKAVIFRIYFKRLKALDAQPFIYFPAAAAMDWKQKIKKPVQPRLGEGKQTTENKGHFSLI
jgi:hypothetical protein